MDKKIASNNKIKHAVDDIRARYCKKEKSSGTSTVKDTKNSLIEHPGDS